MIKWWKRRKARRYSNEFERGYGWAMTAHYLHGMSVQGVVDHGPAFATIDPTAFDDGVFAALRKLGEMRRYREENG